MRLTKNNASIRVLLSPLYGDIGDGVWLHWPNYDMAKNDSSRLWRSLLHVMTHGANHPTYGIDNMSDLK